MTQENYKILICDDSILMRKKLKDSINLCGQFEYLEAEEGQRAIDIYKEERPNIVFMDIVMPVKDGITAVSEILSYDPSAKVVMASSAGTKDNLKRALKAGAVEFIQKPWNQEQIKKIICSLIGNGDNI